MSEILDFIIAKSNYWSYVILMMIGLYAMISRQNYVRKIIGMSIFQTAIILFYVSMAVKKNAVIPIIAHGHEGEAHASILASQYINPLPHVLMLTAIVVGVATLGVALSLAIRIYQKYGTLEENEINDQIREQ
jgi:multicomponent Na+:H+ antiporter subunit C